MTTETPSFAPSCRTRESLWFRSAGRLTGDPMYCHRLPDGVPSPTIFLNRQGKGRFRVGTRSWIVGEQTTTILLPSSQAAEWASWDGRWQFDWLTCSGQQCRSFFAQFGINVNQREKKLDINRFNQLVDLLQHLIAAGRSVDFRTRFTYQRIAMDVLLRVFEAAALRSETKPNRQIYEKDVFLIVDRYLSRSALSPDRVDEVAALFHSTPEHVSRVFKASVGMSLKNYMIQHRINQAKQHLAGTALSIESVGERVGYPDVYHFSKLFKQRAGLSPSQFRKNYWH